MQVQSLDEHPEEIGTSQIVVKCHFQFAGPLKKIIVALFNILVELHIVIADVHCNQIRISTILCAKLNIVSIIDYRDIVAKHDIHLT